MQTKTTIQNCNFGHTGDWILRGHFAQERQGDIDDEADEPVADEDATRAPLRERATRAEEQARTNRPADGDHLHLPRRQSAPKRPNARPPFTNAIPPFHVGIRTRSCQRARAAAGAVVLMAVCLRREARRLANARCHEVAEMLEKGVVLRGAVKAMSTIGRRRRRQSRRKGCEEGGECEVHATRITNDDFNFKLKLTVVQKW